MMAKSCDFWLENQQLDNIFGQNEHNLWKECNDSLSLTRRYKYVNIYIYIYT